jgi:probable rRNA maturation factor
MIKINVITKNNNWFNYIKKPNNYLERKTIRLNSNLKEFKKKNITCTLLLSGNKEIKFLNKKFRKKNKTTDILSFPYHTKLELNKNLKTEKELYLGDIIINLYKIKNKNIKNNFRIEFDRLWIHGLVHLFGYVHKKNKDFEKMNKIEKRYFNLVND